MNMKEIKKRKEEIEEIAHQIWGWDTWSIEKLKERIENLQSEQHDVMCNKGDPV